MDEEVHLLNLLRENRLILLAYQAFSQHSSFIFSEVFLTVLKDEALLLLKNQLMLLNLTKILHAHLDAANIPHVFLKGPALNQLLWDKRIIRYSKDLDVLIRVEDILHADKVLKQLGFKSQLSRSVQKIHQIMYRYTTKKDVVYYKEGFPYSIELHWSMNSGMHLFKPHYAWMNHIISHQGLPILSDLENLLYLCLHAASHGWSRLFWLVDIIRFIDKRHIKLAALRKLACEKQIPQVVDEAIYLAKHRLNISLVPEEILFQLPINIACLQKRLHYGNLDRIPNHSILTSIKKRFYLNFIYSNKKQQFLIWSKIYIGALVIFVGRKLYVRFNKIFLLVK